MRFGRGAGRVALGVVVAVVLLALPALGLADTGPVPTENAQAGTPGWYMPTAPEPTDAGAYAGQITSIDGWAWPLSSAPGDTVSLHVGTVSGVRYRVEVYRLGWYSGAGARLMTCLPGCSSDKAGVVQPAPPAPDPATGEVRSGWSTTDTLSIPASWPSGQYVAQLLITSGTGAGTVRRLPFVVREPAGRSSKIVVVVPVNTWAAYNGWGGKALYDNHSADGVRANTVSFERPWMEGVEIQNWRYDEYPLVRFLERHDLDVSYVTDHDVALTPGILAGHRVVMTSGHGEYWTHEERDAFDAARDAGQSLAFMGANTGYWQVRYTNGGRSMIGYKSDADPISDPALKTNQFRLVGRPECQLLGVQYNNSSWSLGTSANLSVVDASLSDPWFTGTGFAAGATLADTMGYEWDQVTPGCSTPTLTRLFHWEASGWPTADAVRYTAASGAKVFAAGSLQFAWGLDGWRYNSVGASPDARLESFMMRALTDMGGAGSGTQGQPSVTVTPRTATVTTGGTQQFTATLQNATGGVDWSVEGTGTGTIDADGLYTAPAGVPAGGTATVRATNAASGATDTAVVTVAGPAAPQVTTQPASQNGAVGGTATFTAAASGVPAPTVQWQVSTDGGTTYADIPGATSPTLALSGLTAAQSGNRYRAVFANDSGGATTSAAVLTVSVATSAPQMTTQPASQSIVAGGAVTFTAAASGVPAPAAQWQTSTDGGATYTDMADATSPALALTGVTASQSGTRYRVVFTNSAGSVTSSAATLTVTGAGGAPVNDAFAGAQVLTGASGTATGANAGASKETGEPATQAGNAGGKSVWYAWTPSANGSVAIDTAGSSFDTTLGVYTGTAVGALTVKAANDDAPSLQTSRVTLNVTSGTTYRISVDGYNAAAGAIVLHWTLTAAGAPPANDAFAAAQVLTGQTGTATGNNVGASKETGEPAQAGNAGGASIWFSWTPTASGSTTIDTAGSAFDTTLGVYTGASVGALTTVASNDDVTSGVTTSTVTFTATAGTTYRVSVDGYNAASGAITLHWAGNAATAAPQVTTQPTAQTVTAGAAATFTAAASGSPAPTVKWQVSTDGGTTFADVAGATSATLTLSGTTTAQSGNRYRAVFTNSAGSATSSAAALTVNPAPTAPQVTTDPASQNVTAGGSATFTAAASGSPAPTVQWQLSTDGGTTYANIAGATSTSLTLTGITATKDGSYYRAVFTNSAGSATTSAALLTVTTAPAAPQVTTQPSAQTVTAGATATFTAAASGFPAPTVQWQVSTDGGTTFSDVSGATSATLTLTGTTTAQSGNRYRAVFTNASGGATSTAATLTVSPPATAPQVTAQPTAQSVTAGATATFTAAASGTPAPTVQWQVSTDGGTTYANVAGATSATLTLSGTTLSQTGNRYRAVFTNSAGSATSNPATLTVTAAGAPANDAFANAQALTGASGTVTGTNVGASRETGEPTQAGNAGGKSIWYSWTAPAAGSLSVDTLTTPFDTTLGVYAGTSVSALTSLGANDDVGGGVTTSRVTINVVAGTAYRFSVDGYNAASGATTLHWALTAAGAPPANDAFANAQVITGNTATATGANVNATKETGEPSHAGNAGGASVWYSWTPTTSGTATIDTAGSSYDTLLAVYTGTAVGGLTSRASNDDAGGGLLTSTVTLTVTAGTTYRIAVDGWSARQGTVTLHVTH